MSLVSRLTVSAARCLIRSPHKRSVGELLWRGIKTADGAKKGEHTVDSNTILPSDPHTSTGQGDVFHGPGVGKSPPAPKTMEDFRDPEDHWISYGFDLVDKHNDRLYANVMCFMVFTGIFVGWGSVVYYWPDLKLDNWCHREAYFEIERRSKLGRPLISKDYVPADRIVLPTDEELGDTEIII